MLLTGETVEGRAEHGRGETRVLEVELPGEIDYRSHGVSGFVAADGAVVVAHRGDLTDSASARQEI